MIVINVNDNMKFILKRMKEVFGRASRESMADKYEERKWKTLNSINSEQKRKLFVFRTNS